MLSGCAAASCCFVRQGIFSTETSEKVLVPVLLSGVPVATNWDALLGGSSV